MAIGNRITALGDAHTSLDQLRCHVVSDESAAKIDQVDEHRLEGFGGRGVSVRHDGLGDAPNVRLRSGAELNLRQCWVLGPRLCEPAREQRVAAVGADPPRECLVEMIARGGGGASGRVALGPSGRVTADQSACDSSRQWLVR